MRSPQLPSTSTSPVLASSEGPSSSEYVRALHDFEPTAGSTTCLSFRAGQVIRTLNKDDSGWWDGELEGKRGWFPSNYVEVLMGPRSNGSRSRSVSPTTSRAPKARPRSSDDSSSPSSSRAPVRLSADGKSSSVLDSIHQAITLLQNAVDANRVAHFQPSTACVISSVRTVLSASDCLTRESVVLKTYPSLASSRKRILSSLASLVNQARKASSPTNSSEQAAEDAQEMLAMADSVVGYVRSFLEEAKRCGVKLVLPPTPVDGVDGRKGSLDSIGARVVGGMSLRAARSMGDLKGHKRPAAPPISTMPRRDVSPSLASPSHPSPSLSFISTSPNPNTNSSVVIRTPSALSTLLSTQHDALLSTIAAFIGHVHAHTRASHSSSYAQLIDLTRETIEKVREVLVVVEAVSSHPTLVKGVSGASAVGLVGGEDGKTPASSELDVLEGCRERLYVATTALVTAARVATSAPTSEDASSEDEERRSLLASATAVLRSGGDCVGAVKLCIMHPSSKGEKEREFELVLPNLERARLGGAKEVEEEVEQTAKAVGKVTFDDGEKEDGEKVAGSRAGKRANHTLSMLGRKATSLSCLRDMYEAGGELAEDDEEEPVDGEQERRGSEASNHTAKTSQTVDEEETAGAGTPMARHRTRDRSMSASSSADTTTDTVTSIGSPYSPDPDLVSSCDSTPRATPSNETVSTASIAMSRGESSRTSESAASSRSALSRTSTNDTSPRSSLSTTHTDSHHSHKTSGTVPALPSSSAVFSAKSGNASAPNLPSHTTSQPRRPSSHDNPSTVASSRTSTAKEPVPAYLARDYESREISFNADGHVTGGTLRCLVERMTLHDTTIDPTFANTFFLTFRMFTTPLELADSLYKRFDIAPSRTLEPAELKRWSDTKLTPVRLRIYNLFKTWVETYWQHETDQAIVEGLLAFCRGRLASAMSSASLRLVDIVQKRVVAATTTNGFASPSLRSESPVPSVIAQHRGLTRMQSTDRFRAGKILPTPQLYSSTHSPASNSPFGNSGPPPPAPILGRNLVPLLRSGPPPSFSILDIDPLELARQLTIMESRVYCAIRADELLGQEFSKKGGVKAENVRAMSTLSTRLTGWIAETILNEQDAKKRTALVKYFIKLSDRCLSLNNYNTLFAVLCALNSSTISRLKKTWDGLAPKYRTLLEQLRKATEHSRNYAEYRAKIRSAVPPCLPFVGLFLTDITMCSEGNPPQRPSPGDPSLRLINFDRYQKMARIVGDLQRFQVAYNLLEVPEMQAYLGRALEGLAHGGDASSLYRQSLLVEPRDGPSGGASNASSISSHHRADIFGWKG
ncbi:ras guanine nucleotide exchange factor domain-containing protein [Leucosporidium creatinivorum]|uniref:Ras guanine nucleotide exchange factor domain-containing protein n=1 Tax=Leucosporidium creatinivorum TaxID=106004 RepID=A0A1Y2FBC6_9BASI|nr:ras guanine nucleotide exchange factor domain-containing protein [Leucosporidium creatinivorum]